MFESDVLLLAKVKVKGAINDGRQWGPAQYANVISKGMPAPTAVVVSKKKAPLMSMWPCVRT